MAAIAGIFHAGTPKPVDPVRIGAMVRAQTGHRDDEGARSWTAAGVGLGHQGPAAGCVTVGALTIVLDGAIDNHRLLRRQLVETDDAVGSADVGETLLHSWRRWGPSMLDRIEGVFALAIHDAERGQLFLARDRLGARPLHYAALSDGSIAFASTLAGLVAHPLVRRTSDVVGIEDYLGLGYSPDQSSLIAGVSTLAAAHRLTIDRGRDDAVPERWWHVGTARASGSVPQLADALLSHLRTAVRDAVPADGAAGVLLSGGLGSAAVVALMAETSRGAVRTLSVGGAAPDATVAAIVARFATEHRHIRTEGGADPMTVRLAGETGVLLSGAGLAAGLATGAAQARLAVDERVRRLLPGDWRASLFGWLNRDGRIGALAIDGDDAVARLSCGVDAGARMSVLTDHARQMLAGHRAEHRYRATMLASPFVEATDRALDAELTIRVPGDTLAAIDRAARAHDITIRAPWLDHRLLSFAVSMPPAWRHRGGRRWLLARALASHLPREVIARAHGPDVSIAAPVLQDEALAGLARSRLLADSGWFVMPAIARMVDDHRAGQGGHGPLLHRLSSIETELRRLFG